MRSSQGVPDRGSGFGPDAARRSPRHGAQAGYTRASRRDEHAAGGLRGAGGTQGSGRQDEDGGDVGRRPAPEAPNYRRSGQRQAPGTEPPDPRDPGPARPELLGARTRSSGCSSTSASSRSSRRNKIPGFTDALVALMPTLEDHACSLNRRGGFITRLRDGTWAGHVAEHIALELQNLAGTDVRHGKTRSAGRARPVQRDLRVPRGEPSGSRPAGSPSRSSTTSSRRTIPRPAFDYIAELERLIRLAERQAFGPSTQAILDEARQPRHPVHPPRPPLARPARPGRPPAAHPGDDDLADVRHRASTSRPTRASRTGCSTRPACPSRGRRSSTTEDDAVAAAQRARLPVRRQAARRQPRPGRPPRPAVRGRRPRGVRRRARREPRSATSSSRRTSPATTTAAWSSAARSRRSPSACRRQRDRRRRAHRPASSSTSRTATPAAASATRRS